MKDKCVARLVKLVWAKWSIVFGDGGGIVSLGSERNLCNS